MTRAEDESATTSGRAGLGLQASYASGQVQNRLLATHYEAKTALEEQRVDTVYLGLEMLSWREDGTSQKFCRAPLIFLPVELESSDVRDRFKLHYTGEEVGENVSLKEKLKQEYGLKSFPQLSEPEVNEEPACTAWRAVIN